MALLNSGQKRTIRDAIKQVTDTFMVTPVNYHIAGTTFDRFNEDQDEQKYYSIGLKGLVEYRNENDIVRALQGSEDNNEIKVTFNLEDLEELGLITSDFKHIFNPTKDYLSIKAQTYRVIDIFYDGPLDEKDVLVIVKAELSKNSSVEFNTFIDNGSQIPIDEVTTNDFDRWNEGNEPNW